LEHDLDNTFQALYSVTGKHRVAELELKQNGEHESKLLEILSDYRECGEGSRDTVKRMLSEIETLRSVCADNDSDREKLRQALATERKTRDTLADALKEIAHHPEYNGSLCADPADCPNCVARAALDKVNKKEEEYR